VCSYLVAITKKKTYNKKKIIIIKSNQIKIKKLLKKLRKLKNNKFKKNFCLQTNFDLQLIVCLLFSGGEVNGGATGQNIASYHGKSDQVNKQTQMTTKITSISLSHHYCLIRIVQI
jgi:hypothetical protein